MGIISQLTPTDCATTFLQQQRGHVWLVSVTDRAIDRTSSIFIYSPQEVSYISNCSAFITGMCMLKKIIAVCCSNEFFITVSLKANVIEEDLLG